MTGTRALLIPVGLDLYAVPMESVREVVTATRLCRLPTGPAGLLGLFNLRGEIVPMFDTAALLGLGQLSEWPFVVVLRTAHGPAGLAANGLPESTLLDEPMGPSESHGTKGIFAVGRRLAVLIDVETLITPATAGGLSLVGSGHEGP
jgi:purine-binding chemotaxis protein CheW